MTDVSASAVKALREKTGAGMLDCRNALAESGGDMEKAVELLRKKGLSSASKKAGRIAADGTVACYTEGLSGCAIELNSETDFVARNEQFQKLAAKIARAALRADDNIENFKASKPQGFAATIQDEIIEHIAKIGENISLRRAARISVQQGAVVQYIHSAIADGMGKIGVLVALESSGDQTKLQAIGRQLAMHIAAAAPEALDVSDLAATRVEKEKDILREQSLASGKPPEVIEKMLEGRIRKFYEEVVLLEQIFIMDNKTKIGTVIDDFAKSLGSPVKLKGYIRFVLGEGIEKEEVDFAAEVASMQN
ncbi:MAG: elongation factor Ts [Proteobacteria bacterium]|nr:elongation factor Ts [Pseudomonadota bacterium]